MKRTAIVFSCLVLTAVLAAFGFYSGGNDDITSTVAPQNQNPGNVGPVWTSDNVGVWTTGANIITQDYFGGGVGYTRNDTGWVFVLGGNAPSAASTICQKYNVNTNTWTTIAPLSVAVVVNGSAQLRDSIYSFGGYAPSTPTTAFNRYDINSNTWATKAPLPTASAFCKGVGYQDSLIYVASGYNGSTVVNTVYVYNARTDSWRTCTPMPGARFGGAFSRSGDTLIYIGGADLTLFYNQTYRGVISQADRSVITWTTGAVCPGIGAGMYRIDAHNWGCKGIILTGGSNSSAFTSTSNICYTYSPGADVWTAQANKPTAWTAGQSGTVRLANNIWKLVCASGYNGTTTIAGTETLTDTLCASGGSSTLVMWHDTTVVNAGRKDDRDTLTKYLGPLAGSYDRLSYNNTTVFPSLAGYTTIILQETANDGATFLLSAAQRTDLKNWLNSGTPGNKKKLLMIGADLGYNYSRTGAPQIDTVLSQQMAGFVFRQDNASVSPFTIIGTNIDNGNTRTMTNAPTGGFGFWPDGNSTNNGSISLYRHQNHTANDTLAAIGRNTANYIVASTFQDPRYFVNGDFQRVLTALWNYLGTPVGITPINGNVPDVYSLSQNYPNPFNPVTNIKFSIPNTGVVKLVVYDILGRQVATLLNETRTAGSYVVDFDASSLSSGAYFYRLESGNFTETKKMLLVK